MIGYLLLLVNLTVLAWVVAEVGFLVRQRRRGGAVKTREWRSLGVIAGSILVGTVLALAARSDLTALAIPVSPVVTLGLGLLIAWCGIAFRLLSIHALGRFFRGVVQVQEGQTVIQSGPYRLLRHPAYAGALLAVAGFGLTYRNVGSWVALTGCCLVGLLFRIRVEERVLLAEFGQTYADYAARTRRLVPGLW